MKFSIYIKGRSYSFQLAKALSKTDNLDFLITSYPKFIVKKYNVPATKIKSIFLIEILARLLGKFDPLLNKLKLNFETNQIMDWIADTIYSLFFIQNSDFLFMGFGNSCCKIIKKAKKKNIKTIFFLNNSSPTFRQVLKEEYNKLGLSKFYIIEPKAMTRKINESIRMADYIGAVSSFQKQTYINEGIDESKMCLSFLGVDTSVFFPKNIKKDKFIVICVSNDFVRKGVKYLIEAFNSLKLDNSELWIVGKNPRKVVERIVKIEKNNIFIDAVSEFRLPELYNQSSIFCLPTLEDGAGMVMLQAMSCGLPVISTKYSIAPDVITEGEEGFIVEPSNTTLISEKIKFFYDNPNKIIEIGSKARTKIENEFTSDSVAKRIINFCNTKS